MGVCFLEKENLFHLCGGDVSYILKIYRDAFPMHLYWGKRLSDPAISWYLEAPYRRKKLLEGTEPDDPMFLHEYWPFEYPGYGLSDYRPAAFEVVGQDGCCACELRYRGYEIIDGSVALPGLPSVWAREDQAQTLKLLLSDELLGLQVELYYTVFEHSGAITRHTVFRNQGSGKLKLKKALSMSLDMKHAPAKMIQLSGTALREHWIEQRELGIGETYLESTRGISSHQQNPFFALVEHQTTETGGDAYGVSLVYSGNFLAGVSCDMYRSARVQIGIHPTNFGWQLDAGVIAEAWLGFPPAYLVAMALDVLVASRFAKWFAFRFLVTPGKSAPFAIMLAVSTMMVFPMVLFMSLYGALEAVTHTGDIAMIPAIWLGNIPFNFIAALPWNLLIAGPLSRFAFRSAFPEGTVLAEPVAR